MKGKDERFTQTDERLVPKYDKTGDIENLYKLQPIYKNLARSNWLT